MEITHADTVCAPGSFIRSKLTGGPPASTCSGPLTRLDLKESGMQRTTTRVRRRPGSPDLVASPIDGDWTALGACRDADPDEFFVQGAAQNRVKTRCFGCAVRTECLADALDNRVEFGVWGGMTERERRALLRRRPDVLSWRQLLLDARAAHLQSAG